MLIPVNRKPILEWQTLRILQTASLDQVVMATSVETSDDEDGVELELETSDEEFLLKFMHPLWPFKTHFHHHISVSNGTDRLTLYAPFMGPFKTIT